MGHQISGRWMIRSFETHIVIDCIDPTPTQRPLKRKNKRPETQMMVMVSGPPGRCGQATILPHAHKFWLCFF